MRQEGTRAAMMRHLFLIVSVLILAPLGVADICSHIPGYSAHGRSCFKFIKTNMKWVDAEASCMTDGGHLASIHSSEEQAFVAAIVSSGSSVGKPWIGLTGAPPTMAWSDGTDVDYQNWENGAPTAGDVTCTRTRSDIAFLWRNKPCPHKASFICRTELTRLTQAFFTKIPDGAVAVPASTQSMRASLECARRCKRDAQCVHFTLAENGGKYLCETYTSLNQHQATSSPTENYKKIV